MSVRRIALEQPDSFEFSNENLKWADELIAKYPEGKERSAVIPLLWRAQEQNAGWTSEPAMRKVADMLGMAYIRVMEVATFYTMFQLQPVGRKAHVQVCGTTPCMLRGSKDLIALCKRRIAAQPHALSEDGNFSWEEVECLGACVNAPMVQIFKDTYEDLDENSLEALLDIFAEGGKPQPGPQIDRDLACPQGGLTSLVEVPEYVPLNLSIETEAKESVDQDQEAEASLKPTANIKSGTELLADKKAKQEKAEASKKSLKAAEQAAKKTIKEGAGSETDEYRPEKLDGPRDGTADDLKMIKGVGPKMEQTLNSLGIYHFDQIAIWTEENMIWVNTYLSFKGRIQREDWINQATVLATGEETEFSKRANYDNKPKASSKKSRDKKGDK